MEYELVKFGTLLIGLISAAKVIYDIALGKRGRMREEYKFAREFLNEISLSEKLHPYLREKGYQAIAGDQKICADEVEYLLSLTKPDKALRDYVLGRKYLEHLPDSGNLQILFKNRYQKSQSRLWRKIFYLISYISLAILAFFPLLFSNFVFGSSSKASQIFTLLGLTLIIFGPYAWLALMECIKISRAEQLVKHQTRHTQRIVINDLNLSK